MVRILFVCHGNICRSPMAECVMKDLAAQAGLTDAVCVDSAATSAEELGGGVYPPAQRKLREKGVALSGHRARQLRRDDYGRFDLLLGMEAVNVRNILRITGGDPAGKVRRLLDGTARPRDIADPWYSGDFETAYQDIAEGCQALLERLRREGAL